MAWLQNYKCLKMIYILSIRQASTIRTHHSSCNADLHRDCLQFYATICFFIIDILLHHSIDSLTGWQPIGQSPLTDWNIGWFMTVEQNMIYSQAVRWFSEPWWLTFLTCRSRNGKAFWALLRMRNRSLYHIEILSHIL